MRRRRPRPRRQRWRRAGEPGERLSGETPVPSVAARASATVREVLSSGEAPWEEPQPGVFVVTLPGERKQRTECQLAVGDHSLLVNAFVARRPEGDAARLHRWLLERNARMYGVAFSVDPAGDVYLVGRLPLHAVTAEEIDRLLGGVLTYSDGSFNTILELGFADSIRSEWEWRLARGESTANLAAFEHLRPPESDPR